MALAGWQSAIGGETKAKAPQKLQDVYALGLRIRPSGALLSHANRHHKGFLLVIFTASFIIDGCVYDISLG